MLDLKFYSELYVGFQKPYGPSAEILAFATPVDTTSAYKKRKETVDQWRSKEIDPIIVKNEPAFGFTLLVVVSRYNTSNKLFRIRDPRGFTLEISSENLFDLIAYSTISKGTIAEPCVWARAGGTNYLIPADAEEYRFHMSGKAEAALVVGNAYTNKAKNIFYKFLGKFEASELTETANHVRVSNDGAVLPNNNSYYYYGNNWHYECDMTYAFKKEVPGPCYVYAAFSMNADGELRELDLEVRKSKLKGLLDYDGALPDGENFKLASWLKTGYHVKTVFFPDKIARDLATFTDEALLSVFEDKERGYPVRSKILVRA